MGCVFGRAYICGVDMGWGGLREVRERGLWKASSAMQWRVWEGTEHAHTATSDRLLQNWRASAARH